MLDDNAKVATERSVGRDQARLQNGTKTAQVPLLVPVFPYEVLATFGRSVSERLAGLHTLLAWGTTSARGTSAFVAMHEDMHDRILSTTPFGFVQRSLRSHLQPHVSERWRRFATKWLHALDGESAHAHEVAATYLPVKHLRFEEQAEVLSGLPPQYREYYDALAVLIDPHAKASYVQFVIAETIILTAFLSPLLIRITQVSDDEEPSITPDESPNRRFNRLCALLEGEGGDNLVGSLLRELATAALRCGLPSFDGNNEPDWVNLGPEEMKDLERTLLDYVAQWFADRSYGGVSVAALDELAAAAETLVERTKERGVIIGDTTFTEDFGFLGADDSARIVFAAADSVFFNTPIVDVTRAKQMPTTAAWVVPKNPVGTVAVICATEACGPQLDERWFVRMCGRTGDGCSTILVTHQQLQQFLARRAPALREFGGYLENDLYVIGLPAPVSVDAQELTLATMRAALSMFATVSLQSEEWTADATRSARFLGLDRVVFYMHGNLLAWARFIGGFKGARYFNYLQLEDSADRPPATLPRGGISLAAFPVGAGVHVMRFEDAPITFIRTTNTWASQWVSLAIAEYADRSGRITILTGGADEVVRSEAFVNLATSSVEAVWNVF